MKHDERSIPYYEKKHLIQPTVEDTREFGRELNLVPMLLAGKLILLQHVQLPQKYDENGIAQIVHTALTEKIGGTPGDHDRFEEIWTKGQLDAFMEDGLQKRKFSIRDIVELEVDMAELKKLVADQGYLTKEQEEEFANATSMPISDAVVQYLHPVTTPDGIQFIRVVKRKILEGRPLLGLFEDKRHEAYLFLFRAIDQVIREKVANPKERLAAQKALYKYAAAAPFNIQLGSNVPEDGYFSIMRIMDNGSVGSETFRRLLRVKVYVEDLSVVTESWIEELGKRAEEEDELSQLLALLFAKAGVAALDQILIAAFGSEAAKKVSVWERSNKDGKYYLASRFIAYWAQKVQLQTGHAEMMLNAIINDQAWLFAVIISHLTPQAKEWLLAGMRYGWRPEKNDKYQGYNQLVWDQLDETTQFDE